MYYFANKLKFIFSDHFPSTANTIYSFLFSTVEKFEHVQTFQLIKISFQFFEKVKFFVLGYKLFISKNHIQLN